MRDDGDASMATVGVVIFLIFLLILACQPYFESSAYNKLTGAHTTYWDAVWLDLRVQDTPKR